MLDMNLRELILCAASQHRLMSKHVIDAVRHRIQTHPEEVNQQGLLGLTPCHLAAIALDEKLLEILVIEGRADLSILDNNRETPFESAGSKAIKELLVRLSREASNRSSASSESGTSTTKRPTAQRARTLHRSRRNTVFTEAEINQDKEFNTTSSIGKMPQYKKVPQLMQLDLGAAPIASLNEKMRALTLAEGDEAIVRDKPSIQSMPKQRYVTPLTKAINTERLEFVLRYMQEGYLLQDFTEQNGCSTLLYALKMGLSKIFTQLLLQGAILRTDESFSRYRASLSGPITHAQQCQMLIIAQNSVLEQIDWDGAKTAWLEIHKLTKNYYDLLSQQGLQQDLEQKLFNNLSTDNLDSLAKAKLLPAQLLNDLYRICSCLDGAEKAPDSVRKFNPVAMSNFVAGLSAQYNPFEICAALLQLQPHFSRTQTLIMLFVLKEVMTNRATYSVHDLKVLSTIVLPAFFKEPEFKEFKELLQWMALLRSKSFEVSLDNYVFLESLIQHHVAYSGLVDFRQVFQLTNEKTDKRAVEIALALRAYSLMLIHDLSVKELTSLDWSSNTKKHLAPSVCTITNYFNRISNWVTSQILENTDLTQRARFIKLCIKTANELVESEVPDYTSAMAIFSGLNQASITRLTASFGLLDRKTRKIFEKLNEHSLSQHRNYQSMRMVVESNRYAMPYIGVVTSDLTFSQENKSNQDKAFVVGKVANALLTMKHSLRLLHLPITTNVAAFVESLHVVSDNELYKRSLALEPRPFPLNDNYQVDLIKADLETIKRNRAVLKVNTDKGIIEGKEAFAAFVEWLKKGYLTGNIEIDAFEELATIANSIGSTDAGYKFNAIFYQTLKQSPQPIIVQFHRSSVSLNTLQSEEAVVTTLSNKEPGSQNISRKQY